MSTLAEPWMDDLERELSVAATRVSTRLRARRRSQRIAGVAIAAVLLLTGAAVAGSVGALGSFRDMLGAQRDATPADVLPADLRAYLVASNKAGPMHILIDEARLLAALPDGGHLYAVPAAGDDLCLLTTNGGMACGPRVGPDVPLIWMAGGLTDQDTLVTGLARDDVRAVEITIGGKTETVPVTDNTFWYREASGSKVPTSFVADLADGSKVEVPTGVAP
jgi:hypothetical protein